MPKKTGCLSKLASPRSQSTFAGTRIEKIIGRVFSVAATAMSVLQLFTIAIPHAELGNATIHLASVGLIILAQLAAVYSFWFGSANKNVYLFHGAAYAVSFVLYPIAMAGVTDFPDDYRSWLWWWTGTATMAMGMFIPKWWSFMFLGFVPVSYFFLRLTPAGGGEDVGTALLDAIYALLYAVAVLALVGMLRSAAADVDQKNDEVSEVSVNRAAADAAELERRKLDDLVHDQVLTTVLLAAQAISPEQRVLAAESATQAIDRLQKAAKEDSSTLDDVSVSSFIDTLTESLKRSYPEVQISVTKETDFPLPMSVGIAIADASIQALTNSVQHAGNNVVRQVRLRADHRGLKVVVKDDGRGFRESKIPANRLGVRHSIRRRVVSVGASVNIQSEPRKGATVILKWVPNA